MRELIKELQNMPLDLPVFVEDIGTQLDCDEITKVTIATPDWERIHGKNRKGVVLK